MKSVALSLLLVWLSSAAAKYEIMIPAYANPCCGGGPNMWNKLIETQTNHPDMQLHVIFNPASGPGATRDPNYVTENKDGMNGPLLELKNAGAKIYGYVATTYAVRSIDLVKADIDLYVDTLYPNLIDGFFLDEMSTDLAHVGYYREIDTYSKVKIAGAPVVGNPGVSGTQNPSGQTDFSIGDYGASVDVIMTFEQTAANYASSYSPVSWTSGSEAHLLYAAGSDISSLIQDVLDNAVNYLYITDDGLNNPWDALSSSWNALAEGSLDTTTPSQVPSCSQAPSSMPSDICVNSEDWFYVKEMFSCNWIARKPWNAKRKNRNSRCNRKSQDGIPAKTACLVACSACPE